MSRVPRRLLPVLVSAALLAAGAVPARAETLSDLAKRLGELRRRVEAWIDLTEQDPDKDRIARYRAQQEDDFRRKGKGHVTAADLFAIVLDKSKPDKTVRIEAGKALEDAPAKNLDPDLAPAERGGGSSKRAKFAKEHLIPALTKSDEKKGDRWIREIVDRILNKWFMPTGRNAVVISQYNADAEKTWSAAATAWRDVVKDG